jgi:hypothetical protein
VTVVTGSTSTVTAPPRRRHFSAYSPHLPGLSLLAAVAVWIMRRFLFTGGVPAGTDMLGFISRSAQYATFGRLFDAWSAESFGSRRVFNFDNIMGALTLVSRNPMATVKLLDVLTLLAVGVTAYALAWSWYRRRLVATTGGLFYMASQASLAQWGSGHLNVEVVIALAPLMLLTWSSCLERFTLRRSIGFTSVIAVSFLVRADLALYILPFLVLYMAVVLLKRGEFRKGLANAACTLALAVPGVLALNSVWLIPSLAGYRVQYETLNQIFSISSLSSRSLALYPSLLGFAREIGYFSFTGVQTWYSFPWLPVWKYYVLASVIPLLAYSALWWRRDHRTVFLVTASLLATLAAPGSRPPLGGVYLWAAENIPVFGNLRDPNRWLVVQALAYAVLASLTIDYTVTAIICRLRPYLARVRPSWPDTSMIHFPLVFVMVGIGLVPVLPTFVDGLRTWHVTPSQLALLGEVRDTPGPGMAATIPFGQDYRFVAQGSYRGYEHDLGYESVLFTGRQDVGDGGWDQRSANFIAYETSLLDRGDPAFSAMLASAGVRDLISFHYPLAATHQLRSQEVGPYSQQTSAAKMRNLALKLSNRAGTDFIVAGSAAPLSFRRNIAVVLGGSQGTAALMDRPGFKPADWAIFSAEDVIETQGYSALLDLMRTANVVLLADERPLDIAVEGARPVDEFPGITSDSQTDRQEVNVPTDQSAQVGSISDVAVPIPQPQSTSSSSVFSVRLPDRIEVWARVLATQGAATIQARVDGRLVGSVTPATLGSGGFEWLRVAAVRVGSGSHRVTLSAVPSTYGDRYEVDDVRLLNPSALGAAEGQLDAQLTRVPARVAYAFDLADVAKWSWPSIPALLSPARNYRAFSTRMWKIPIGSATVRTTTPAPGGTRASRFMASAGHSLYTVAKITYKRAQNWKDRPYVYLEFKGSASGRAYQLVFNFGPGPDSRARYTFSDDFSGWRTLAFPTSEPGRGSGTIDWSRVEAASLVLPSQAKGVTFAIGVPHPSRVVTHLTVPLPIMNGKGRFSGSALQSACFGGVRHHESLRLTSGISVVVPVSSMMPSCRIYAGPRAGYRQMTPIRVRFRRSGTEKWSYSFSTLRSGVLVWTEAYDPLWKISGTGRSGSALPVMSLLNGYVVGPGRHIGTIAFVGESSAIAGLLITVVVSILLCLVAIFSRHGRAARHPD